MRKSAVRIGSMKGAIGLLAICLEVSVYSGSVSDESRWQTFLRNRSVLGLEAGEATMKSVIALMGPQRIDPAKGKGHELVRFCYKSPDAKTYVVFLTGYLHDFETLYGFELYAAPVVPKDRHCVISKALAENLATPGGLHLKMDKQELVALLGKPSEERGSVLSWKIDYHEVFREPHILYQNAGPTHARYRQKIIQKGVYHYPRIEATLRENRGLKLDVFWGGESDFEIENPQ